MGESMRILVEFLVSLSLLIFNFVLDV
jgi:hypothetical protein